MYLLSGEKITCGYGAVDIVINCNIGVYKGKISSVVGPNGAGKSTAMKALFGLLPIKHGKVFFDGEDITNLQPQQRVLKGMGFVPQTNNIFPSLTVQENLEMGAFIDQNNINEMLEYVYDLFPILKDKKSGCRRIVWRTKTTSSGWTSFNDKTKTFNVDEPSAGVSPIIMDGLLLKLKK